MKEFLIVMGSDPAGNLVQETFPGDAAFAIEGGTLIVNHEGRLIGAFAPMRWTLARYEPCPQNRAAA